MGKVRIRALFNIIATGDNLFSVAVVLNVFLISAPVGIHLGHLSARSDYQSVHDFPRHVLASVSTVSMALPGPFFTTFPPGAVANLAVYTSY